MRWMRPSCLLLLAAGLTAEGCTSGVVVRNELAYPITVQAFESGNPPLTELDISSGMLLSSEPQGTRSGSMAWADWHATVDVAQQTSGLVTRGGQFHDPSGRKSVNLMIKPASGTAQELAAWKNCAVSMPPPVGPFSMTVVLRRRNDGSGLLEVEATDQLGNEFEGVLIGWNVQVGPPASGAAEHQ